MANGGDIGGGGSPLRVGSDGQSSPEDPLEPLDRLDRAHRLLRRAGQRIDRVASEEGWPGPFGPLRLLLLHHLDRATVFGLTPIRLARLLQLKRSTLAHHLDSMEDAGLIHRQPRRLGDRRRVAVRLTEEGAYVVRRSERILKRWNSSGSQSGSGSERERPGASIM